MSDLSVKRIFIAGIIQGSYLGRQTYTQDYRERIKSILNEYLEGRVSIYCPVEHHPSSIDYDDEYGREVFFEHIRLAGISDLLVAYLPEASMGTAIEIYQAYTAGKPVIVISPLKENWVVRFLSTVRFDTIEEFEEFVKSGAIEQFL